MDLIVAAAGSEEGWDWLLFWTIPAFTGVVGWLVNWSGVWMLFNPVAFKGWKIPGLHRLARVLPRKVQEVPGVMDGGVGWQGIIPARAAKMGSISVDKAIAKLGTPAEFYQQLEPDQIAAHIVELFEPEIPGIVDGVMRREHPELWRNVPTSVRTGVYDRVKEQLPEIVRQITDEIGTYIDQLLDPKVMVIDHFERNPALINKIFRDIGQHELRIMIASGFVFGFLLGIPLAVADFTFHQWWILPAFGIVIGWTTNLLGMSLIFEPVQARKIGPFKLHGLFLRRQDAVAEIYAGIIADEVITLERIGDFLLNGPRGDRTRKMLVDAMGPAIDRAAGRARSAVRVAVGTRQFDAIRDSVAVESAGYTMKPFQDPEFSKRQSGRIRQLIASRTREMSSQDFVEMLRSAIKEDEWMLYVHGAIMGLGGGFLHLAIFGVSGG